MSSLPSDTPPNTDPHAAPACHAQNPRVLVTRPEPDCTQLSQALSAHAWRAVSLPLVTFEALAPPHACDANHVEWTGNDLVSALRNRTGVIVVSQRAVTYGLPWIRQHCPQLITQSAWFSIGPATTKALQAQGVTVTRPPAHGLTTETLLTLSTFSTTTPQDLLILRGADGRQTLHDMLRDRGHRFLTLDVYRRRIPTYTVTELAGTLGAAFDCYTCTSGEILENLTALLRQWGPTESRGCPNSACPNMTLPGNGDSTQARSPWLDTPLLVVGQRQATLAKQAGFTRCLVSPTADTRTLVETLNQWRKDQMDTRKP